MVRQYTCPNCGGKTNLEYDGQIVACGVCHVSHLAFTVADHIAEVEFPKEEKK